MKLILRIAAVAAFGCSAAAYADCRDDIDHATSLAMQLQDSRSRGLVIDEIGRAKDMRHDGDEEGCKDQIKDVLALVNKTLADIKAKARAESAPKL